jgi:hypothetical protein
MYAFGETYAQAKAWAVANLDVLAADIDNVQTDITTMGGQALSARAALWYSRNTLFADLPASSLNVQPVPGFDLTGHDGDTVGVADGAFVLSSGGGGGFSSLGAFDTTPNAKGLSSSGTTLSLAAADGTHPGGLSAAAQDIGGVKNFKANVTVETSGGKTIQMGKYAASFGLWLNNTLITPDDTNFAIQTYNGQLYLNTINSFLNFAYQGNIISKFDFTGTPYVLDLTALGVGGQIKLKSPDGTTYTLSVANGGTLSIV